MKTETTTATVTPADEDRAALFLARSDGDFPELAGLFASHREAAQPSGIEPALAAGAALMIRSLMRDLSVGDHLIEIDGRIITASGIQAKLANETEGTLNG